MKLSSAFELNNEHFALHIVSSPLVKPFIYHVHYSSGATQRSAFHTAPAPIQATVFDDKVELINVPARYNDPEYLRALKMAIKMSLIGE